MQVAYLDARSFLIATLVPPSPISVEELLPSMDFTCRSAASIDLAVSNS